jgi:hypothetical protein
MSGTGDVKIGRSNCVDQRIGQLQTACPHNLKLILHAPGLGWMEKELHRRLVRHRTRHNGEWFADSGLGLLPLHLYELIPQSIIDNPDWWKSK